MAYYGGHHEESIIRIYNVPIDFLLSKLKCRLEKFIGSEVSDISRHGTSVEAHIDDLHALNRLPEKWEVPFQSERIELRIAKLSQNGFDGDDSDEETFHYLAKDTEMKAIFRFLDHQQEHKDQLSRKVAHLGIVKIIPQEEIEIEKRSKMEPSLWKNTCKSCVEKFLNAYTSWSKQLDEVSDPVIEKNLKDLREKYKKDCFVIWYKSTSTILATGKKEKVEKVKSDVENILHSYSPQRVSQNGNAQTFMYNYRKPAILRFVHRNKQYWSRLHHCLLGIAESKFILTEKIIQVEVNPTMITRHWAHEKFEFVCLDKLEIFFSDFDTVKCVYPTTYIQSKSLKDINDPMLFVKWFKESGTAIITGLRQRVEIYKDYIEKTIGSPQNVTQIPPPSPSKQIFHFKSESVPPAVLKYIFRNADCKAKLKVCCGTHAKVRTVNEEGSIKIEITLNKNGTGLDTEKKCKESVQKYLENFSSENLEFDAERLARALKRNADIATDPSERVFIQHFPKVVKVTGFKEDVDKKVAEILQEVECDVEEEILPVHVFIVQRECKVWKKVMDYVPTVTITSFEEEHKVVYKGTPGDINRAKRRLGLISEGLHEGPLTGLKTRQNDYIAFCMKSQEMAKTRAENKLEWLYALFRKQSLHGALAIEDGVIHLLCESKQKWSRCIKVLQQNIMEKKIQVSGITTKILERIHDNTADISVLAQKSGSDHIIVIGNCKNDIQLGKIVDAAVEEQDMEKREYKMPRQRAEHIIKFCKIDQAQKMELFPDASNYNQQSVEGLMITCAKEDIDAVDMWLEELQIERITKKFSGYSIHEYLSGNGKAFLAVVENETKSSIFLQPVVQTPPKVQRTTPVVYVVLGNILEEKCDAIVISTGSDISDTGQVGQSLLEKYGDRVFAHFDQNSRWEIPNKLYVVSGCQRILPWKYVFKYVISPQNLKKDLIDLFLIADKLKIKSLTLPTMGAGNLGLTGDIVASNMQEALEEFKKQNPTHLRSIKVVVFDKSLLHYFNPLASGTESAHFTRNRTKSHGTSATVYSNNKECLKQALKKLQETIDQHFKEVQLNNKPMEQFSNGIKEKVENCCRNMDVFLTWEFIGSCEHCKLQGIVDNVRKAEDEVKKILHNDSNLPFEWTSMPDGERYHKEILQRNSTEYKKVKARFTESNPSFSKIIKIARIQNPFQYKQFRARSDYVRNLPGNATKDIVKQLFHGTNGDRVEKICRDSFDRGFAGENGTAYGRGVYFAVNSRYSESYARISSMTHHRYMFLADVVTGEYQLGRPEYRAAPNNPVRDMPYDSLVNNVANPEIFVVFPDASVYPSYLITFV